MENILLPQHNGWKTEDVVEELPLDAVDDASKCDEWISIVRKTVMPAQFDRSIEYIVKNALDEKPLTGKTNPETWQLWKQGYVVLRNFIPKDIITMTIDNWKTMKSDNSMGW